MPGPTLRDLGFGPFFLQQLDYEELERLAPARVMAVFGQELAALGEAGAEYAVPMNKHTRNLAGGPPVVGDWLLLEGAQDANPQEARAERILDRTSLFRRKAAGERMEVQHIAANVDTAFIVTSCNQDFNTSRLERYMALVYDAGAEPVIVITKTDLALEPPQTYTDKAAALRPGNEAPLDVVALNAKDPAQAQALAPWLLHGHTVALLGSSGVGKSTILNTLSGGHVQRTSGIREDDAKGRHTTTHRSLHILPSGALLLDSPGMRELQLFDAEDGLRQVFEEIDQLVEHCRFSDCQHQGEPGCAVQQALDDGHIDPRRHANYMKLLAELNEARLAEHERRARDRRFSKLVKSAAGDANPKRRAR